MKINHRFFTPPHVCIACILAFSLVFFTGCMTEADGGQVMTPVENPTNPETPKATYTITFDANGGTGEMNPQTAESGTEITLFENTFTKDGNIFAGWATSADGDVSYTDKAKITVTGNITLYAKWAVTAANISEAIKNIPADGKVHTVVLAGEISEDTITAIRSALYENSNARISLDMSGTTGLTKIPDYAFYDADKNAECKALAGIVLPEGIESINNGAFQMCANLTDIVIPDSVKTIGNFAFYYGSFASIKFGSRLESIGEYAFNWCNSLTEITVPGNVKTIGYMAFDSCSNLEKVVLEEGVQTIGSYAFSGCEKLTSVTIPKSVTFIGDYAFSYCDALQTVSYGGTMAEWNAIKNDGKIDTNGNDDLLNAAIYCTDGIVTTADKAAAAIATLEGGTRENPNVYMIRITDKTLTAEQQKEIGTAIRTKTPGWYGRISLDLSSATELTEIPEEAFSNCRLRGLILPDSLEIIGIGAFGYNRLEEIVIPDNVKTIEDGGFEYCSDLTAITLPASLTSIGASAFKGTALKTVNYKGTQAQWAQIKIDDYNDKLTGAKIICTPTAL